MMKSLIKADAYRMFSKKWIWLCCAGMMCIAAAFVLIQSTAMDYEVSIDRVIFLPMAFYGTAVAALVSIFVGIDYDEGMMRAKIAAGKTRRCVYSSGLLLSVVACEVVYTITTVFTLLLSLGLFTINITAGQLAGYFLLGVMNAAAYSCIYYAISIVNGNKAVSIAICMGLSFAMLFLCLHTNQELSVKEFVDGVKNPAYLMGAKRIVYICLHYLNPSGQSAMLAAMNCEIPLLYTVMDAVWIAIAIIIGGLGFRRKEL